MSKIQKKVWKGCLTVLLLILLVVPAQTVWAGDGDWPQFQNDAANTGSTNSSVPDTAQFKWVSEDLGAIPSSGVVVANGKVFVNCGTTLKCLSASTGSLIWSESIGDSKVYGAWGSPAYHNGRVFIATDQIYCFSENGGSPIWAYDIPHDACDGSVTVVDGYVIAGDWDGYQYFCINATSGELVWSYTVTGTAQGTPAIADGKVYLTSWGYVSGHVYCLNLSNGEKKWETAWLPGGDLPEYDTCGSPCVADGKVFVTTYNFQDDGELVALDAETGAFVWDDTAGGRVRTIQRSDATPAYYDGKIYVCGGCRGFSDIQTYCFNADDGSPVWQTAPDDGIGNWTCSVAVADGIGLVGKAGEQFFDYAGLDALDALNGTEIWHYDHGGSSPAIAGGCVYTVGEGKVWAFGTPAAEYPVWDVNTSGSVDKQDMEQVGNHLGESGEAGWIIEDVNKDGHINVLDLVIIGNHFGE
jgi:outer membrane protein assembly factor BamB